MRVLILVLSAAAVVLAALILLERPPAVAGGPVLEAARAIADAEAGEWAEYRDQDGYTLRYRVERTAPGSLDHPPRIRVRRLLHDPLGQPMPSGAGVYEHVPTRHGLFPLAAPDEPEGYDRVWVWERIRRVTETVQGRARQVWRVDLLDPALPPEGDADHVVVWLDERVPVFGIVRWQRSGRTWDLVESGRP